MSVPEQIRIALADNREVSALLVKPPDAERLLVLAHGAGAGMHHPFMEKLAAELAAVRVATLRYQFPYMQDQRRVPDPPALLTATVAAAVQTAAKIAPALPLLAGGKSMGGRMTSQAAAQDLLAPVNGLVFFGFPCIRPIAPERNAQRTSQTSKSPCSSCKAPATLSPL